MLTPVCDCVRIERQTAERRMEGTGMASENELYKKTLLYIHQHYSEDLSLRQIAESFYVNAAYLGRLFTRETDMSFAEYLASYRIRRAMKLLEISDKPIIQIANTVGYSSPNHFYKLFRKYADTTPHQYRRECRQMVQHTSVPLKSSTEHSKTQRLFNSKALRMPLHSGLAQSGGMIPMPGGRLRFFYSDLDEEGRCCLFSLDSFDDGISWETPRFCFRFETEQAVTGLNAVSLRDGAIAAFFLTDVSDRRSALCVRKSYDGGSKWTTPEDCAVFQGRRNMLGGRMLRVRSSQLILPFSTAVPDTEALGQQQMVSHYLSDDDGASWQLARVPISFTCRHSCAGLTYPMAVECAEGALLGFSATSVGRQYEYASRDGGNTWSQAQPSFFTAPMTPMHMIGIQDGRYLVAAVNPVPDFGPSERYLQGRLALFCASTANLQWGKPLILENVAPDSNYVCLDPYLFSSGKALVVVYRIVWSRKPEYCELMIRRIDLSWLLKKSGSVQQ